MGVTVDILALRIIWCLIVIIHLLIVVNHSQFLGADDMILLLAFGLIAREEPTLLLAVAALSWLGVFDEGLVLSSADLFLDIYEPDVAQPIDTGHMRPDLLPLILDHLECTLDAGAESTLNLVNL